MPKRYKKNVSANEWNRVASVANSQSTPTRETMPPVDREVLHGENTGTVTLPIFSPVAIKAYTVNAGKPLLNIGVFASPETRYDDVSEADENLYLRIGVTLDEIHPGKVGRVQCSGGCLCRINMLEYIPDKVLTISRGSTSPRWTPYAGVVNGALHLENNIYRLDTDAGQTQYMYTFPLFYIVSVRDPIGMTLAHVRFRDTIGDDG